MGAVNVNFVVPAILLDNPGVTREEFSDLLNQIHVGDPPKHYQEWDKIGPIEKEMVKYDSGIIPSFHHGVYGLAKHLGLNYIGEKYPNFNIELSTPYIYSGRSASVSKRLDVIIRDDDNTWQRPKYKVSVHKSDKLTSSRVELTEFFQEIEINKILDCEDEKAFVVRKILEKSDYDDIEYCSFLADVIKPEWEENEYFSIDDLSRGFPELSPDSIFNWEQNEGIISNFNRHSTLYRGEQPRWEKRNNKYYLQNASEFTETNYTSLIITAEAIREKAWGLFAFRAYAMTEDFLLDFPESRKRHDKAVVDWQTSQYAKNQGMTNNEYLRWHLANIKNQEYKLSDEQMRPIRAEQFKHVVFDRIPSAKPYYLSLPDPILQEQFQELIKENKIWQEKCRKEREEDERKPFG
jgi:hypothetical protein